MKSEKSIVEAQFASYEEIASEYYDQTRHPTCNNFREASGVVLDRWLHKFGDLGGQICEVGAGDSLLAELLIGERKKLGNVLITDVSASMLQFSKKWADLGARLVLAPAHIIPALSGSIDWLVSSLGDPYNEPAFWHEAHRVLRPGGKVFFTTPAYDWAQAFRQDEHNEMMSAEFELVSGRVILVPSWIYPPAVQVRLIKSHNLQVDEVVQVRRSMLKSENMSPKLFVRSSDINVVTGYLCSKLPPETAQENMPPKE